MNRIIKFRIWAKHLNDDKYKEFDVKNAMPLCPGAHNKELFTAWQKEWDEYNEKRLEHINTCFYHKMVYPSNFTVESDTLGWTTQGYLDTGAIGEGKSNVDFEPDYVLMQFTGLKDKNGREVYEGDIIQIENWYYPIAEVIFQNGAFRADNKIGGKFLFTGEELFQCSYEVIGNIYENPDSL